MIPLAANLSLWYFGTNAPIIYAHPYTVVLHSAMLQNCGGAGVGSGYSTGGNERTCCRRGGIQRQELRERKEHHMHRCSAPLTFAGRCHQFPLISFRFCSCDFCISSLLCFLFLLSSLGLEERSTNASHLSLCSALFGTYFKQ